MHIPIRVLLADDHPFIRAGIKTILLQSDTICLVGEAGDGHAAQTLCQYTLPDVLLLDVEMPGPSAIETVSFVKRYYSHIKILVLTAHYEDTYIRHLLTAGVTGYMLKDEAPDVLVTAIHNVSKGIPWFSQAIIAKCLLWQMSPALQTGFHTLSGRECDLVRRIVAGDTNQEIGVALAISEKTVEKYVSEIYRKLGVTSRVEAAVYVVRNGYV